MVVHELASSGDSGPGCASTLYGIYTVTVLHHHVSQSESPLCMVQGYSILFWDTTFVFYPFESSRVSPSCVVTNRIDLVHLWSEAEPVYPFIWLFGCSLLLATEPGSLIQEEHRPFVSFTGFRLGLFILRTLSIFKARSYLPVALDRPRDDGFVWVGIRRWFAWIRTGEIPWETCFCVPSLWLWTVANLR